MTFKIRSLHALENDLESYCRTKKTIPVVLVDTGALIDMEQSARDYLLTKKIFKKTPNPVYTDVSQFLVLLSGKKLPLVITPNVFGEITQHSHYKVNNNSYEINHHTFDTIQRMLEDSTDFLTRTRTQIPLDDAKYDVYWISKESCKDNRKKYYEEFSEADKGLLVNSLRLCRSYIEMPQGCGINFDINPVIILSPDQHLSKATDFIRKFLSDKYPNIMNISTRYKS